MQTQQYTIVPIGDYDWVVLKAMGEFYFVFALSPLFKGYYSLEPCLFPESKLCKFLNNRFREQLRESGAEVEHIRNIGILSLGQYNMYVKGLIPPSVIPFLLLSPFDGKADCMSAINRNGDVIPVELTESCGIRPCFFADKAYLTRITGGEAIVSLADIKEKTEEKKERQTLKTEEYEAGTEPKNESERLLTATSAQEATGTNGNADKGVATLVQDLSETRPNDSPGDVDAQGTVLSELRPEDSAGDVEAKGAVLSELRLGDSERGGNSSQTIRIDDEGGGFSSVCCYGADYDRFAMIFKMEDERSMARLKRRQPIIYAFLMAGKNDDRAPVNIEDVASRFSEMQSRWVWDIKRKGKKG